MDKQKQVLDWLVEFYAINSSVFYGNARYEAVQRHPECTEVGLGYDASRTVRRLLLEDLDKRLSLYHLRGQERVFHDKENSEDYGFPEYKALCLAVVERLEHCVKTQAIGVHDNHAIGHAWRSALAAAIDRECPYTHTRGLEKLDALGRIMPERARDKISGFSGLDMPNQTLLQDFFSIGIAKELAYFRMQYLNEREMN